jgi:hypothetical protein
VVVTPSGTIIDFFTLIQFGPTSTSFAVMRSRDNGATWEAPIRVGSVTALGARDPDTGALVRDGATIGAIADAPNGTIYVAWQDARLTNGARDAILLTRSTDGSTTWRESRVAGPFDLAVAPIARGYFLGDYQALTSIDQQFLAVYARTNNTDFSNRNDIFARLMSVTDSTVAAKSQPYRAELAPSKAMSLQFQRDVEATVMRKLDARVPGWTKIIRERNHDMKVQ